MDVPVNWEAFWCFFLLQIHQMENAEGVIGRKQIIEEFEKVTKLQCKERESVISFRELLKNALIPLP